MYFKYCTKWLLVIVVHLHGYLIIIIIVVCCSFLFRFVLLQFPSGHPAGRFLHLLLLAFLQSLYSRSSVGAATEGVCKDYMKITIAR